jgi:hypothetical protein
MSTPTRPRPIEERLTAALHARADQVTPEDLTPLLVPAPRRSRRTVVAAAVLAAAAVSAVVALPLLDDVPNDDRPAPPASSLTPTPSPEPAQGRSEVRTDLDGDGKRDRAWIEDGQVRVRYTTGTGVDAQVEVGSLLLPPVTDAGTRHPIVVAVPPADSDRRATTVTFADDIRVRQAPASLALGPGRTVWVDEIGALMLGEYDANLPQNQRVPVAAAAYRAKRDGELVEYSAGDLCWDRTTHETPVDCQVLPHQDADPSLMFPMVEERYPVDVSHGSFDGPYDDIVLERTRDGFELSYTWDTVESRAPVPADSDPELLGSAISSSMDAPAVVVAYAEGESERMSVYAPTSEGFRALDVEGDRFLGNAEGDSPDHLAQRTWMSLVSGLWSASQVSEDEPNRYLVTRWTVDDTVLRADDQGYACLDPERGRKLPDESCGLD